MTTTEENIEMSKRSNDILTKLEGAEREKVAVEAVKALVEATEALTKKTKKAPLISPEEGARVEKSFAEELKVSLDESQKKSAEERMKETKQERERRERFEADLMAILEKNE